MAAIVARWSPGYATVLPVNGTAIAALATIGLPAAGAVLLTLDLSNPYSSGLSRIPPV
jgi:hypothetical protein